MSNTRSGQFFDPWGFLEAWESRWQLLDDLQQVDFCVQLNLGFFEQFVFSGQFSATAALEAGFGQPVLLPSVVETGSFV